MYNSDNPALLPKVRSRPLLDAIRFMPCELRIASLVPGHRCADQSTVVGCHLPTIGKGMSTKVSDLFVAAGCQHCHDIIDGRDQKSARYIAEHYPTAMMERMMKGNHATISRWVAMGLLTVEGMEIVK